jgi:hypothetical protein
MKNNKYVEETFKKILRETLEEKAESIVGKINKSMDEGMSVCNECGGSQMYEGECMECGWKGDMEEGIYDVEAGVHFPKHQSFDYVEEDMNEEKDNYNETEAQKEMCKRIAIERPDELEFRNCDGYLDETELGESLHGGQKKLDKNKNGRLDAEDFRMLRKSKKHSTDEEMEEGNAFSGALAKARKSGDDDFKVDGKTYHVTEGNHFTGKLYKALEEGADEFEVNGKIYPVHKHLRKKHKKKAAVKESIQLTEDEMIDLIERIVREQKENDGKTPVKMDNNLKGQPKPPGLSNYERAVKGSKNENEKYYKEVSKKMKDYLKDGSKGDYEMNPKHFPAGNGELAKMAKKAYVPSDSVKDYVDNLTAAGQENLVFDEIHPNEEWMDKNIEGSSTTGNNPEWANAVETPTNKKRNEIRKNNLLGAIKKQAYHKSEQPIVYDKSGDEVDGRHSNLNFKKANKIMAQLESTEDKKTKVINEEMNKMKNLIGYNRKTQ